VYEERQETQERLYITCMATPCATLLHARLDSVEEGLCTVVMRHHCNSSPQERQTRVEFLCMVRPDKEGSVCWRDTPEGKWTKFYVCVLSRVQKLCPSLFQQRVCCCWDRLTFLIETLLSLNTSPFPVARRGTKFAAATQFKRKRFVLVREKLQHYSLLNSTLTVSARRVWPRLA